MRPEDKALGLGSLLLVVAMVAYPLHGEVTIVLWLALAGLALMGLVAAMSRGMRSPVWPALLYGVSAAVIYPVADWGLFQQTRVVNYLVGGRLVLDTPVYVVGLWAYAMMACAFIYLRYFDPFLSRLSGGLAIAVVATTAGVGVENIGNVVGLWASEPAAVMLGAVPAYIGLGYLVSFALLPWFLTRPLVGGAACSACLFLLWWLLHQGVRLVGI